MNSRRRVVIALGSGAVLGPLASFAQQVERVRRIGVLTAIAASDPEAKLRITALKQELQKFGWKEEQTLRIDARWTVDAEELQFYARELLDLKPDLILTGNVTALGALRQETRIPIVFVQVPDPVEDGLVKSLAKPGGNITGFTNRENATRGKWLEMLKEVSPRMSRAMVIVDQQNPRSGEALQAIQVASRLLGVKLTTAGVRDGGEIDRAFEASARVPNGGLITLPGPVTGRHRERIIAGAARHRMPAIYPYRYFVTAGGLMSYGADTADLWRRAASYVDRILRGDKPGDLPVQAPTKFELVINLKTARALGLEIPRQLLLRADEVIE